ncbi:glycosyltransferase [candidate division CSSED10-310 bacterium]|uniref:Glycosyltransferase n=1 Tax=candidate division CSSED10-310 bacterium TaxID=2855610 RepID=A0ABV6YR86_UNCC1
MSEIAVLVLHYNSVTLTNECLRSVQGSISEATFGLFVIDNSEKQDYRLPDWLKIKRVKLIKTGQNCGYAGGMNQGIKAAVEERFHYLLLLNNDTTIASDCITRLVTLLQSEPAIGIIAPLVVYHENSQQIWSTGSSLDIYRGRTHDRFHNKPISDLSPGLKDVDVVTGCAMMIRAEVFSKIGYFDELYFTYYEDADFCYRAREFGYRIIFTPTTTVYHHVSASSRSKSKAQHYPAYWMYRNRIYFMRKFFGRTRFVLFLAALCQDLLFFALKQGLRLKMTELRAAMLGCRDGLVFSITEQRAQETEKISACIITRDCEKSIESCLESINEVVDEIIILDSGSEDGTLKICQQFGARIFNTPFQGDFAALRNKAASYASHPWILALDADEMLSKPLQKDLKQLTKSLTFHGFSFKRQNFYGRQVVRYGYPAIDLLIRLYRGEGGFFSGKVHEKVISSGPVKKTNYYLIHRQPVNNYTPYSFHTKWTQYIDIEAEVKSNQTFDSGGYNLIIAPIAFVSVLFRDLIMLLGILHGYRGLKMAYYRALYHYYLNIRIYSIKKKRMSDQKNLPHKENRKINKYEQAAR